MTIKKPIKRSPYIISLSRDHHHTLLLCWKVREGILKETAPNRIGAYASYFNEAFLEKHFSQEEELLFSKLKTGDKLKSQGYEEHKNLQSLFGKIASNPTYELLNGLAEELDTHIRFEERSLFPHIEKNLSKEQLKYAAAVLEKEHEQISEHWEDEFWEE